VNRWRQALQPRRRRIMRALRRVSSTLDSLAPQLGHRIAREDTQDARNEKNNPTDRRARLAFEAD
jgi:hypothetical protein